MKKKTVILFVCLAVAIAVLIVPLIKWGPMLFATVDAETQQVINRCKEQRIAAYEQVKTEDDGSVEQKIKQKIYRAWAEWVPDYAGWLNWSDDLYLSDATIVAIGGEQPFKEYQKSMEEQRKAYRMEMGPIDTYSCKGNVVDITYQMYLIPRTLRMKIATGACRVITVHEVNTFAEDASGEMMVSRLVLKTHRSK